MTVQVQNYLQVLLMSQLQKHCSVVGVYVDTEINLRLLTTAFLVTRKSSLNSSCQFSIAVCTELKFQSDMFS